MKNKKIKVVDLFCGIGGLTHGFIKEGFDVVAGIDNDPTCKYGYEKNNNNATYITKDIADVSAKELDNIFGKCDIRVLVGCAPCQPYSRLNLKGKSPEKTIPLLKYAKLVDEIKPDIVSMENVRGLADKDKNPEFSKFLKVLEKNNYKISYKVVDTSDYGVPQKRHRLVLLASRLGDISLIEPTHLGDKKVTVRDAIGQLDPIKDGEVSEKDSLHRARKLSALNKKRVIKTPKNGGSSCSWGEDLMLECHKKPSGKTYRGTVYGRMRWDEPSPTMTTQCIGLGNGRFGHPEQNRAISLREAALFQTFPISYKFIDPREKFVVADVAKFIGNAVPVKLGRVIAKSIKNHLYAIN
ncbi:TPA: DNA (cytosine-5-)-methyltransferase [Candidatus Nomurabacteria bacterium]|nr:DNA (cytosine-5-)-methyltransferase [Candidatus Nomurabacteria bacterium]HCU01186.1 DNA (cytosine-5-)-methyltransferase [Candidatus Nomurabacteria bacterium]